ncbi:hypothetical protein NliqN6_2910 [Naganishia liquefaciens]|uniref:Uncharacterized protein n=1 Tax=Naganishia liquefaciens TaxID=104408 RepID=A0A8H3TTB8_9TREE|nr:hypothetical protein NliqN6_2910 [Naganishia liquefaciens]
MMTEKETPDDHTPLELPHTPDSSSSKAIGLMTPVEKKVRFSSSPPGRTPAPGPSRCPSTSSQISSSSRPSLRIPEFPAKHTWKRAVGLVEPVYTPFETYQGLRAAVDECHHPDVKTFHEIFDCWARHCYTGDKSGKQNKTSLSWCDLYANYVFMACEFFVPRTCFEVEAHSPIFFGIKLPRDDLIAWIISFLTGKLFARKMITSRMQTLKKTITEKNEGLWKVMMETRAPSSGKKTLLKSKARKLPAAEEAHTRFHPFLAYLLRLDDSIDNPSKAFTHPALDVSKVEPPRGFLASWIELRHTMCEQAGLNKAARDAVNNWKSCPIEPSRTPPKASIKRKREQSRTPSKQRIVAMPIREPVAVAREVTTIPTARIPFSSKLEYDTDEVYDDDSNDTTARGSRAHSPSLYHLSTLKRPSIPAVARRLHSETPSISDCRTTLSDDFWKDSNPSSSIDSILDRSTSLNRRLENVGCDVANVWQREQEADAVNALLDLGQRYRVHVDSVSSSA